MEKPNESIKLNEKTTQSVLQYIKRSWVKSIRPANDMVPYPFTSPSITGIYTSFFYWDNYFIHHGLMLDGLDYQVKNNLDNFKFYVERFGYVPNASSLTNRSQPPIFARSVYDYYLLKRDETILQEYLPAILKEYEFWMTERILPCGLNSYGHSATKFQLQRTYDLLAERVAEIRNTEEEQIEVAKDILAVAESGLDFNVRFETDKSKIDAHKFIHLDLNCILFDVENTIAQICQILNMQSESEKFLSYAKKRKQLTDKYLFDESKGIYLDYNFVDGTFSKNISVVSLYPYTFGISSDKNGAKKVLKELELPYGISTAKYRGENAFYYQWDYPCVWPSTTWFAFVGLKAVGLNEDAERIAKKYMHTVNLNFQKTGIIWEKYDGNTGGVGVTTEYETPEMLGWSAGVYRYFAREMNLDK